MPIALRLHYFAGDWVTLRFYYRYYWDTFGINAHTFNLEVPLKFSTVFTLFPYYRYHTQTAADYFQPFKQHQFTERYRTSDFDLSDLHAHRYGLGMRIAPLKSLMELKLDEEKVFGI